MVLEGSKVKISLITAVIIAVSLPTFAAKAQSGRQADWINNKQQRTIK